MLGDLFISAKFANLNIYLSRCMRLGIEMVTMALLVCSLKMIYVEYSGRSVNRKKTTWKLPLYSPGLCPASHQTNTVNTEIVHSALFNFAQMEHSQNNAVPSLNIEPA